MHRLPCPDCSADLTVAPTQAGDTLRCPACGAAVNVPTLGELRQLPLVQSAAPAGPPATAGKETSMGQRMVFGLLGSIALVSLLISGFCWVRWALIDVPITTEAHIEQLRDRYQELTAAELIREYEDIEEFGIDLAAPMNYRLIEWTKMAWKRNALISGAVALVAILAAAGLAWSGRRTAPRTET